MVYQLSYALIGDNIVPRSILAISYEPQNKPVSSLPEENTGCCYVITPWFD